MVEIVKALAKPRKKKADYFDNVEMINFIKRRDILEELSERTSEEEKELRRLKEKIGTLYFKISEGLMRRPNFCNYDAATKTDMISDAVFNCLKAGQSYDTKFTNPHAYFSQISWNAFILNIKAMKKRSTQSIPLSHVENLENYSDDVFSE
jgi:hypothetical protein